MVKKKIKIAVIIFAILSFILIVSGNVYATNNLKIVLDPGHGGAQPGAVNSGIQEKDVTLKIARYLKEELEKYEGVTVYMTHNGLGANEDLEIFDRGVYPRKINADLLVSLHINSSTNANVSGAEVYVTANTSLPKYNFESKKLGESILNNIINLGIKSNGVLTRLIPTDTTDVYSDGTRADYYGTIRYAMRGTMIDQGVTSILENGKKVVVDASASANVQNGEGIPSILVEHCYISNSNDRSKIDSDEDIRELAKMDCAGIVQHYGLKLKSDGTTSSDSTGFKIDGDKFITEANTTLSKVKSIYSSATASNENLPTGSSITIDGKTYTITKLGDNNADGVVDAIDLLVTKKHLLEAIKLTGEKWTASDLNKDGVVDAVDLLMMKKHLLGTNLIKL